MGASVTRLRDGGVVIMLVCRGLPLGAPIRRRAVGHVVSRRRLRGDGFEPPSNRRGKDAHTTVACFCVSLEGCTPRPGTCYFPVFSGTPIVPADADHVSKVSWAGPAVGTVRQAAPAIFLYFNRYEPTLAKLRQIPRFPIPPRRVSQSAAGRRQYSFPTPSGCADWHGRRPLFVRKCGKSVLQRSDRGDDDVSL